MQNADVINADNFAQPKLNYLTNGSSLKSWLLTKDHKRIAIMYLDLGVGVLRHGRNLRGCDQA